MLYDRDIREPLYRFLESELGKIRILEEKNMGRSRADVVMVMDNALCGLEIKSDADTFQRLERQVRDYGLYYDYNCLVVGESHQAHAREHVPESWGILVARREGEEVAFTLLRGMRLNPERNMERKLSILWRPEMEHILSLNHLPAYREKSKKYVTAVLLDRVPHGILQKQVSEELFERDYTRIAAQIAEYRRLHGARPVRRASRSTLRRKRRHSGTS